MLIWALLLSFLAKHIDFSNPLAQADLKTSMRLEVPTGFEASIPDAVLELNKSLCGQIKAL
jgi:hypothetical protein